MKSYISCAGAEGGLWASEELPAPRRGANLYGILIEDVQNDPSRVNRSPRQPASVNPRIMGRIPAFRGCDPMTAASGELPGWIKDIRTYVYLKLWMYYRVTKGLM
jgi:hypothetical protein